MCVPAGARRARAPVGDDAGMIYVDLRANPEGYTGYDGELARRVWRAIYEENCFDLRTPAPPKEQLLMGWRQHAEVRGEPTGAAPAAAWIAFACAGGRPSRLSTLSSDGDTVTAGLGGCRGVPGGATSAGAISTASSGAISMASSQGTAALGSSGGTAAPASRSSVGLGSAAFCSPAWRQVAWSIGLRVWIGPSRSSRPT